MFTRCSLPRFWGVALYISSAGLIGRYGILRGYVENLLVNFAQAFSEQQLAEIRIVLDQLSRLVFEDKHLNETTKQRLDHLAQVLRESESL